MLHDLLERILSAIDENDKMWSIFRCYAIGENVNEKEMYLKHDPTTSEEEWHPISYNEKMDKNASVYS